MTSSLGCDLDKDVDEEPEARVRTFTSWQGLRAAAGTVLGTSDWRTISQERIDAFAEISENRQWIHTDRRRSAVGPYGAPIAPGYLTLSLLPAFAEEVFALRGVTRAITYGLDRVRFIHPVRAGARLRSTVRLTKVTEVEGGIQVQLTHTLGVEVDGREQPACVAETTTRLYL